MSEVTTEEMSDTGLKRAGGLPASPDPVEEWVPPTPETEEVVEPPPVVTGPVGPSSNDAFRAQKAYEDGEDPGEDLIDPIEYIQANFHGAPSDAQIDNWKKRFGLIMITGLTDDEVFIWRPIQRTEYKNIMRQVAAAAEVMAKDATAAMNIEEGRNSMFIEKICEQCVLWPAIDVDQLSFSKAGTLDTLANLVLEASNFMSHQVALRLSRRL